MGFYGRVDDDPAEAVDARSCAMIICDARQSALVMIVRAL
jgi:hypothetical protein